MGKRLYFENKCERHILNLLRVLPCIKRNFGMLVGPLIKYDTVSN